MVATVAVSLDVLIQLQLSKGDSTPLREIKDAAKVAAEKLIEVGLFHANRENKDYNSPKLVHEGRDVSVNAFKVGRIVVSD